VKDAEAGTTGRERSDVCLKWMTSSLNARLSARL
jgi:hypothetical protein